MRRIVLTLTDEEYDLLEQKAQQERRTPREMAAYLVTRPQSILMPYTPPTTYPQQWWQQPTISRTTATDSISRCQICGQSGGHLCGGYVGSGGVSSN